TSPTATMTLIPVFIWTLILWTQECRGQATVTQTPAVKSALPGETVTINCRTSPGVYYSSSYGHWLHWFSGVQTEDAGDCYCQSYHYISSTPLITQCYRAVQKPPSVRL
ncbi:hypothetical protein QTP70_015554, partial [Hemibagrus guttatus]